MNKRVYWIDWLKVFTMILVVYAHICNSLLVTIIFSFHMPLFLFISGFLHKQRSFKDELRVTFKSLIIPYFILTFAFLAINLDVNLKDYFYTLLCSLEQTPYYIRPMWFVYSLAVIRIVVSALKSLNRCIILSLLLIVVFSVTYKMGYISQDKDLFQMNTIMLSFPYFVLGKTVAQKDLLSLLKRIPLWAIWIIGLPFVYLAVKNGRVNLFKCDCGASLLLFFLDSIALTFVVFMTFAKMEVFNRFNYYVEMMSKGMIIILAYHLTAFALCLRFIDNNTILGSLFITAIIMFIGFFLSLFCWKRIPILFGKKR